MEMEMEKKMKALALRKNGRTKISEATFEIVKGVQWIVMSGKDGGNPERKGKGKLEGERMEIAGPFYKVIAKDIEEENKMKRKKEAEEKEERLKKKKEEDELKMTKEEEEEEPLTRERIKKFWKFWFPDEGERFAHEAKIDKQIEDRNY